MDLVNCNWQKQWEVACWSKYLLAPYFRAFAPYQEKMENRMGYHAQVRTAGRKRGQIYSQPRNRARSSSCRSISETCCWEQGTQRGLLLFCAGAKLNSSHSLARRDLCCQHGNSSCLCVACVMHLTPAEAFCHHQGVFMKLLLLLTAAEMCEWSHRSCLDSCASLYADRIRLYIWAVFCIFVEYLLNAIAGFSWGFLAVGSWVHKC